MATKRIRPNGKWEFRVTRTGLLPKPVYLTFDTEAEGDRYVAALERALDAGYVPPEFAKPAAAAPATLRELIREYQRETHVTPNDAELLGIALERYGTTPLPDITVRWIEETLLRDMKRTRGLVPGTIRHHIGALARCFDWLARRSPEAAINPFRLLPRGYASYSPADQKARGDQHAPTSGARARRLEAGEEKRIISHLNGLDSGDGEKLLFVLALETAMRLREIFTLTKSQVNVRMRTAQLPRTKNGKARGVPLSSTAAEAVSKHMKRIEGERLFPLWSGSFERRELERVTALYSARFSRIFAAAGCPDLHFHDLRHEAVCRFYERTDLSDLEIMKITGHSSMKQLATYANLRARNLAKRLW
jgi:integrase